MEDIYRLLNKPKYDKLKKYYENSRLEIKQLMDNIYSCAYRFNLLDVQIEYLLKESIKPFGDGDYNEGDKELFNFLLGENDGKE